MDKLEIKRAEYSNYVYRMVDMVKFLLDSGGAYTIDQAINTADLILRGIHEKAGEYVGRSQIHES